ncbi:aryl-alcohol dehydrogenase-like predicted oxidoreductase [Cricetibacter osteomyelitidis]|uniref:Aryl-alcohol dehydrogenase-like predicted oxidoreductase n=1 Tax=Cricetibacter osteomyelitidis TaxID=1521931 RepID=A0A4V2T242_9PAST|nr:aldo/keto reductase [Cricetibacter osteomyelitidis]TCP95993.1 aryl-alcohol dehydrogenase-like predicted oxidoreductase [Cricetibacter osteomyelitidis]
MNQRHYNHYDRRQFLKLAGLTTTAVASTTLLGGLPAYAVGVQAVGLTAKNAMPTRQLGALTVSQMGLGCMNMSVYYGTHLSDADGARLIRQVYDMGIDFFDTAEVYGAFTNETLVGKGLKPFRQQVKLATKFGFNINDKGESIGLDSRPASIRKAVEGSLKHLQTDYIDLLYQHRVDPNVPIEDVAGTVKDLVKEGKVLHFGLSEAVPSTIRKAHAVLPVAAVQSEFSLLERSPESNGVFDICQELGIGFVAWGPLQQGLLTGKLRVEDLAKRPDDLRHTFRRFSPENLAKNAQLGEYLQQFGRKYNATAAQIALAWVMAKRPFVVPIAGTGRLDHLQENLGALQVPLTAADILEIETAFAKMGVAGERMNEAQLSIIDKD